MPFTVLRRFSGSDYLLPGLEEQDRPCLLYTSSCVSETASDGVGLLADYTLEELRSYNMAAKFVKRPMVERIVTFEEMCELLAEFPELMFNIDMKTDDGTIANRVADIVENKGYKDRVVFNGLNGRCV